MVVLDELLEELLELLDDELELVAEDVPWMASPRTRKPCPVPLPNGSTAFDSGEDATSYCTYPSMGSLIELIKVNP